MRSFGLRSAFLAAIGIAALTLPATALNSTALDNSASLMNSAMTRLAAQPSECFTDEGYGRKRSCSAGFHKKNKKEESLQVSLVCWRHGTRDEIFASRPRALITDRFANTSGSR